MCYRLFEDQKDALILLTRILLTLLFLVFG